MVADSNTNDYGAFYEHISGADKIVAVKSNWEKDWKDILNNGVMQVQYTGGDSTKRFAKSFRSPVIRTIMYYIIGLTIVGLLQNAR